MSRQKSPDYSSELRQAIEAAKVSRIEAAAIIGVRLNTLHKMLAPGMDYPTPKSALDLFQLKVAKNKKR